MMVLDTCALLWWTLDPAQLSDAARAACDAIPRRGGCLSAISMWEIGIKWQRKKLDLGGLDLREYVRRVQSIAGLEIVPVSGDLWVENIMLEWAHRDTADRTIVATALMRDLPVVTCDQHITGFYSRVIW